jgi:predicted DCC family thiol-disulfide oxidoreductase YuxK
LYYALQLEYLVTPFALWFRQFEGLLTGLTYYVYFLELIGPILIFSPIFHKTLRPFLMVAFMTMHLGFAIFLEIGLFPVISIIMNLTFFPGWIWDRIDGWRERRTPRDVTIWFDRGCDFCEKSCRLIRTLLVLPEASIRPAQDDPEIGAELAARNSWVVTVGEDRSFRSGAMGALFAASAVFRPISGLVKSRPVQAIGDLCYDLVARNRSSLSGLTRLLLPWRPETRRPGWLVQTCAGFFLVFITVQNISTIPAASLSLPESFIRVRQALGLYQNWTMFAPHPELTSPWPVIEGMLADGTQVDVYEGEAGPADFSKPGVVSAVYRNHRWRKFLSNLEDQSYADVPQVLALSYGRYLCRTWSSVQPDAAALSSFRIYFQVEWTPPPGKEKYVRRRLVWTHDCLG